MARAQVNLGQVTEQLRPVAAPIDTYVRPADPPRSPLWDLASSLGGFERELDSYVASRKAEADKLDAARAEADHLRNNSEGYAEGVAAGHIPAWSSPAYVNAYKEKEGASLGNQLMLKAQAAYMTWDGKDGTDPTAFDKFSADFLAKNITTQDPRVLRGLLPVVRGGMASLQAQFHQDLSKSVYEGNIKQHGIVSSQTIDQYDLEGLRQPTGTDYEGLWDTLMTIRGSAIKVGAKGDDYDKTLIKTLTEKAVERRDPGILKLLDRQLPGSTYALSDTAGGASSRLETLQKLDVLGRQAQLDAERRFEKDEKRLKAGLTSSAIDLLANDPTKPLPQDLLDAGQRVDPEFKIKALEWQRKLAEGGVQEDPKAMTQVYADIFNGGGMGAVSRALSDGTIKTAGGLKEATAYAKAVDDGGGVGHKILQGATVDTILKTIESRAPNKTPLSAFDPPGISDAGLRAQTEFKRALIDWATRNPSASEFEKEKARSEIGGAILGGLGAGLGDKSSYTRPADAIMKAVGAEPGVLPPRPTPPPAPQPSPVETFKQGFSAEDRQRLEQRAIQRGLDPNAVWLEMQKAREAGAPPGGDPRAGTQQRLDELQRMYTPRPQGSLNVVPDASGTVQTAAVRALFAEEAQRQGLVGLVPPDGARYGIRTGSAAEWSEFFTRLSYHESGHNVMTAGDGGRSKGLLQLSSGDSQGYGLNGGQPFTDAQLADPRTNAAAGVTIAKSLLAGGSSIRDGLGRYWGPISKEGWTPGAGRDAAMPNATATSGGTIDLPGIPVVNSMKPGAPYGRTATAKAEPFKYIVYHTSTMGGGADEGKRLVDYTQGHDAERGGSFGYHFLIDRDGTVHQIAPESARTNHIRGPGAGERKGEARNLPVSNSNAIGISTVGDSPNPKQREVALALGKQLMARYGIAGSGVYGHGDLQSDREDTEGRDLAVTLRGGGGQSPAIATQQIPQKAAGTPDATASWLKRFAANFGLRL